jgi:hypothetical protein
MHHNNPSDNHDEPRCSCGAGASQEALGKYARNASIQHLLPVQLLQVVTGTHTHFLNVYLKP